MELETNEFTIEKEVCLVRRMLGIQQNDFANVLGITKQTMSRIESGKVQLSPDIGTRLYFVLTDAIDPRNINALIPLQQLAITEFLPKLKQHIKANGICTQGLIK